MEGERRSSEGSLNHMLGASHASWHSALQAKFPSPSASLSRRVANFVTSSTWTNRVIVACSGWVFIPYSCDNFRPTWVLHSRYSRVYLMWARNCFFFLPLDAAYEGTPIMYSKIRASAGGEGWRFRWDLWNNGISSRLPSVRRFLAICSKGLIMFGQIRLALISPSP